MRRGGEDLRGEPWQLRYFSGGAGIWALWRSAAGGIADHRNGAVHSPSVGISAGPAFVGNLRRHGAAYVLLCLFTAISGSLVCAAIIRFAGIETPVVMGLMTGAYTSSPGFASAKEAFAGSADAVAKVAAGYGIMYPVGTLGKVLFVQLAPKLCADMERERALIRQPQSKSCGAEQKPRLRLDPLGFLRWQRPSPAALRWEASPFPLPGLGSVCLGNSGGPLLVGLLLGHLGHVGPVDLRVTPEMVGPVKEIGLVLFLQARARRAAAVWRRS